MAQEHKFTNRLIHEKSPYLLQHAHNPVDWYPWSEEAFTVAKVEDKPIFLSIGYATCHWCHVMERESFEDVELAKLMNATFINIKVDREELPEVDSIYMEFAQTMMAGAAGWPLNVVLTPGLEPFFAATYLPAYGHGGLLGLADLIYRIREIWKGEERDRVMAQAARIVEIFEENIHYRGDELPQKEQLEIMAEMMFKMSDPTYGGMKGTPKFPVGYHLNFMMNYSAIHQDSRALFLVDRTLEMMHRGGIYDHIGGGFSRYSVDEKWLVPHFEKMLYDNALLGDAYLKGWKITGREEFKEVAIEVCEYILRDMCDPKGGFYSAEDADSEGHEGWFYTWKFDELQKVLGKKNSTIFCDYYGATPYGNFEGRNILHMTSDFEDLAEKYNKDPKKLKESLQEQKRILWETRDKREHPLKDDKILTSWNGLMIYTMSQLGIALYEKKYLDAAAKAANFIYENLWLEKQLFHRWREGEALFPAGIEDYAFLIRGLISLFEADYGLNWLLWAMEMTDILEEHFKAEEGAFFQTDGTDQNIIVRKCQFSDGTEPSSNAIHCENLLNLFQISQDRHYLDQAIDILKAAQQYLESYPPGYCYHLINLNHFYDSRSPTFVIALDEKETLKEELRQLIYQNFIPHKSVIWHRVRDEGLRAQFPYLKHHTPIGEKTTFYQCFEGVCKEPLTDFEQMKSAVTSLYAK